MAGRIREAAGVLTLAATLALVGEAGGQEPGPSCPADRLEGWLGISGLTCSRCVIHALSATVTDWSFATEPEVTGVDPDGPVGGVLRPGDLLVGIDGHLITSRAGGRRFGSVRPGDRVTLRFRRDGEVRSATFTAVGRCVADELPESPETRPLPEVENVLDRLGASSAGSGRSLSAEPSTGLELPPLRLPSPGAFLGLSFQCGDCLARVEDGRVAWRFARPPEIVRVEPGTPAHRAGLRAGDLIRRIHGSPIESREGGEAFGAVAPGDTVRFTVSRPDGSWANVALTPTESASIRRAQESPLPGPSNVVRYTGTLGPAHISVAGAPVSVLKEEGMGILVIRTANNEIRIRVPVREGGEGR